MCLLTNDRYKTFLTEFSFGPLGHACPRVWDLGVLGGQKFNFLNMVMWHIKLKGMSSRPGYTENFYPRIYDLGMGSKDQIPLDIFESVGISNGTPSNVL